MRSSSPAIVAGYGSGEKRNFRSPQRHQIIDDGAELREVVARPRVDLVQVDILDLDAEPFEPAAMRLKRQPEVELPLIGPRQAGVGVNDIAAAAPPHKRLEAFETEIGEVIRQVPA